MTKGDGNIRTLSGQCKQKHLFEPAHVPKSLTLRAEWQVAAESCRDQKRVRLIPDLILGQSGIQVPEDGLQVHRDDAHRHVFSKLPR